MSNLHQFPKQVQEYLQMKHEEVMLRDQLQSVRSRIRELSGPVSSLLQQVPNMSVPIQPSDADADKFGDPGTLRLIKRTNMQPITRSMLLENSLDFYRSLFPDNPEMAQLFAYQHTDFILTHRERTVSQVIDRVSVLEQERKKLRKRQLAAERPKPVGERKPKEKKAPTSEDFEVAHQLMRQGLRLTVAP